MVSAIAAAILTGVGPMLVPEDSGWGFTMEIPWAEGSPDDLSWQSMNGSMTIGEKAVSFTSRDEWTSKRIVGQPGYQVTVPIDLDRRDLSAGRWELEFKVIDSLESQGSWTKFGPITVAVPPAVDSYPQEKTGQRFFFEGGLGAPDFETLDGEVGISSTYANSQLNLLSVFNEGDGSNTYLFDTASGQKLRLNTRISLLDTPGFEPLVIDDELQALREEYVGGSVIPLYGYTGFGPSDFDYKLVDLHRLWRPRLIGDIWSLGPLFARTTGGQEFWAADAADLRRWIRSE